MHVLNQLITQREKPEEVGRLTHLEQGHTVKKDQS
jgi:hypothetical protein